MYERGNFLKPLNTHDTSISNRKKLFGKTSFSQFFKLYHNRLTGLVI